MSLLLVSPKALYGILGRFGILLCNRQATNILEHSGSKRSLREHSYQTASAARLTFADVFIVDHLLRYARYVLRWCPCLQTYANSMVVRLGRALLSEERLKGCDVYVFYDR